jgi:peptidyl-prolyl cis-trans isomerase A (cyclophilin A)
VQGRDFLYLILLKVNSMANILFIILISLQSGNFNNHTVQCEIKTSLGNFVVELFPHNAPVTTENFLKYVDAGLYNGTDFFRVQNLQNQDNRPVKIEVIQGGNVDSVKSFPSIRHEPTSQTGLLHKDGTLSMARGDTGTAQSSFFICINDQPELDFGGKRNPDGQGFAVFGKVVEGMDVVRKIYQQPFKESAFTPKILIISVSRKS